MTQLRRGKEFVVETEFLHCLRREVPRDVAAKLMSFVVPRNHAVCVGLWKNRSSGLVEELGHYQIGETPTRAFRLRMQFNCRPDLVRKAAYDAVYAQTVGAERAAMAETDEEWDAHIERIRYMQSHTNIHTRDNPAFHAIC